MSKGTSFDSSNFILGMFMEWCTALGASSQRVPVSDEGIETADMTESVLDCDVAVGSDSVTAEENPGLLEWAADSGSSGHMTNSRFCMKS